MNTSRIDWDQITALVQAITYASEWKGYYRALSEQSNDPCFTTRHVANWQLIVDEKTAELERIKAAYLAYQQETRP